MLPGGEKCAASPGLEPGTPAASHPSTNPALVRYRDILPCQVGIRPRIRDRGQ
ncbi:hypothetical protein DPMN_192994 [Dreissena polymorpha]|uniref:Uncharacterized protein n=1 Tax=Dreissena polymorpha TaxID=45954 RepID=A0A9D3XZZ7_DREPO|nr:hypothetical protein DPMN_192994 [Dreissena polymorpha]